MLTCHYGGFSHPYCECYPRSVSIRPLRTDSGIRWAEIHRIEMAGDLVEEPGTPLTPAVINTRLNAMDAAYSEDNKDFGFKLDGSETHHWLSTNDQDNLSHNYVAMRSWDNVLPTEWANTRSFTVAVEAIIKATQESVIEFSETTTKRGNGGEIWRLYETWEGEPVREKIADKSKVTHITRGRVVTMDRFLTAEELPQPYWPNELHGDANVITYKTPRSHGSIQPSRRTHYITEYAYFFERLGPDPMTNFNTWVT